MAQEIIFANGEYSELTNYIRKNGFKKIFLVCGKSMYSLPIGEYFTSLSYNAGIKIVYFSSFEVNPSYESVKEGIKIFKEENCDVIFAVGGGSAIDVAKCIKLYSNMDSKVNYLLQTIVSNKIKLLVIPTTAGSGSEATRFAVIYYNGEKQSVANDGCLPSAVVMDASALKTLPLYQRKSTMMDAFCHAVESFWSVNSTDKSRQYSRKAIKMIISNIDGYMANRHESNIGMLNAANLAGKAINISQTTAGHAMCYKLSSLYKIAHGHAAALCLRKLWPYMITNINKCTDLRGEEYLSGIFMEIAAAMGCNSAMEGAIEFEHIFNKLGLDIPEFNNEYYIILKTSVNHVRLKNNPIALTEDAIGMLYQQILRKEN